MKVISYTDNISAPSDYYNHHNSDDDDDRYQYSSDDEFDHNDDPSIPPPAPPLPVPGSSSYLALFSTEKHRISSLGTTSTASSRSFLSAASSTVPSPNTTNDDEEEEEHRHQPPTTTTTQDDRSCLRRPWKYASKKNQQKMRIGRTTSKNKKNKNKGVAFDVDDDDDQSNHAMITTAGNFRASTISALGMFSPTSTRNVQAPTSTRDVLHDIQQAETEDYHNTTTTGMMTPSARIKEEIAHFDSDNSQDHMLIHSLNNSYHTDDEEEYDEDLEGGGQETTPPPSFARYADDPDEDDLDTSKSTRCCTACLGLGRSTSELQNRTLNTTSGDSETSAANSSVTSQKRLQRQRELRIYYAIGLFIFILMCIFFGIGFYIIYHNNHGW